MKALFSKSIYGKKRTAIFDVVTTQGSEEMQPYTIKLRVASTPSICSTLSTTVEQGHWSLMMQYCVYSA